MARGLSAAVFVLWVATLSAQGGANPFSAAIRGSWDGIKQNVLKSAELMPETGYSFKPTPKVRTFGEILGHLANEHYLICSTAKGEANPNSQDFEKTTAKAEMVKALRSSIEYCDGAYGGMTDAVAQETVKVFGSENSRIGVLTLNVTHDSEHYGNLITYLRMKDLVPPSSAQQSSSN